MRLGFRLRVRTAPPPGAAGPALATARNDFGPR